MNGVYSLKKVTLAPYISEVQKLLNYFADVTITHIGRNNNKHADCLATLASKLQYEGLEETLIVRRGTVASTWLAESKDDETDDWRTPIVQELNSSLSQGKVSLKTLQSFFMLHGVLYRRNPDGSLLRCLGDEEAQLQLNRIHEIFGQTLVVTFYRRLQRLGFYWPDMETQSRSLQGSCSNCQLPPHQLEVFNIGPASDWQEPYISYLRDGVLPASKKDASKMKQRAKRFVFHEGILYRKRFGGFLLRCLAKLKISILMKEMHEGEHQGKKKLFLHIHEKYYWPTMKEDAAAFVQRCNECQIQGNLIHAPSTPLHSAYRTAPRSSTGVSPYSLVYGADAILLTEIKNPSARIAAASGVHWNETEASCSRIVELDALDSGRDKAEERTQIYRSRISKAYDKAVKPRIFKVGDLVLKTSKHIQQDMSASKFSPKWEGPYVITMAYSTGYYKIIKEDGGKLETVINGKCLKAYYA
ncbi:uncharacterized protein LOC113305426 [Papaver somniferum]|uniref:uncharacterized protein LOC113305426 n=1 Tax=Papaver somniferum TaxID=3469 RepID=UPI000E7009DA|nr:uncharacterized protein LOC113305426 [Papaver somniferum]